MFEKNPSVQIYTITIKKIEEKSFCYFPPCNEKDANGCTKWFCCMNFGLSFGAVISRLYNIIMLRILINFNTLTLIIVSSLVYKTVPGLNSELFQMNHLTLPVMELSLELNNKPYLFFEMNLWYALQPHQCKQLEEKGTCIWNFSTECLHKLWQARRLVWETYLIISFKISFALGSPDRLWILYCWHETTYVNFMSANDWHCVHSVLSVVEFSLLSSSAAL